MPNVTLIRDNPQETLIKSSTVVQSNILTGPPGPQLAAAVQWIKFPTPLPTLPVPYTIFYKDMNGVPWVYWAGDSTGTLFNTVEPEA